MSSLLNLLQDEKKLVKLFLECLRNEQAALVAAEVERLGILGQQKLGLIDKLNDIESRRLSLIGHHNPLDKSAMHDWFAAHPEDSAAEAIWSEILSLARDARRLHQMNGELIRMHLEKTQEAIAVLTLRQKEVGLYGSDGQASSASGSRLVDSA